MNEKMGRVFILVFSGVYCRGNRAIGKILTKYDLN